ncbi:MAG TPA: TetR/AcrR family transcriptional regulator [Bryobacteraceae bacterium]|jgi:TetR/AcrR family transcriptional repressor of nem operon
MNKGDLTKERIIEAAAPVFNRNGFVGTSLSDLMEATGLQKGGIYRHFKSKEELAVAAFDHAWQVARKIRWLDVDKTEGAIGQLQKLVANFVERRTGLVQGGCPVLNTAIDSDDGNPVLRENVRKALQQWAKGICDIVAAGIQSHEIRRDVDPQAVATMLISALEGAIMMTRLQESTQPFEKVREYLNSFLESLAETS